MSFFSAFLSGLSGRFGHGRGSRDFTTVIPDGTDETVTSRFDGQRFVLNKGDSAVTEGEPVLDIVDDRVSFRNAGTASSGDGANTINVEGDKAYIDNQRHGKILADDGTAVGISGEHANVQNRGLIDGDVNGVNFENGGESSGRLSNYGTVQSDSRAVNIGGDGIKVENHGKILGTGDQRNGTIYSDGTAENYRIWNGRRAEIDAGEGNDGAGIALQTGDHVGDAVRAWVTNHGTIQGRGQAEASSGEAGDGIRLFSGVEGGGTTFRGDIYNAGDILSESQVGATSAIRVSDGLSFDGKITNTRHGLIDGANNGLYFGDAEHDVQVKNYGTIQSDSRAVNIDGSGVDLHNYGKILGTGDQRNGTIYSDSTAEDYSITNYRHGRVDAGEGNNGAAVALQTGNVEGDVVRASITNFGVLQGRGQAEASGGQAGDGLRVFSGVSEGETTFKGDIYNAGKILSESRVGATSAVRFSDGLGYNGTLTNARSGLIDGANNGLYFGLAAHDATVKNFGTIQSDSRAVNIDGSGVDLHNFGKILGTGDQRNGTVYSDGTAEDFNIVNHRGGLIDAGAGNNGTGIALQIGDVDGDVVTASVTNHGTVRGRGDVPFPNPLTSDGIRVFSGVEDGTTTFRGDIENRGDVVSDSTDGIVVQDVRFEGNIVNYDRIEAADDGIDLDPGVVLVGDLVNSGRIEAGDDGFDLNNASIVGEVRNSGTIDAGDNAIEVGTASFTGDVVNDGRIEAVGEGILVEIGVSFDGNIVNRETIEANADGIEIDNVAAFTGEIRNEGTITGDANGDGGGEAFDGFDAQVDLTFVNDGTLNGDVLLGQGDDEFDGVDGTVNGEIFGGSGEDTIEAGDGQDIVDGGADNDQIGGGAGDDELSGGAGNDFIVGEFLVASPDQDQVGDDSIYGGSGRDTLSGDGSVVVGVRGGDDSLFGGEDGDFLYGDASATLQSNAIGGNDELHGGAGGDRLVGDARNILLGSEGGDDVLYGGAGNDSLYGEAERSDNGNGGDDRLFGGTGEDELFGNSGADTLDGGADNDLLTGGSGNDTFVFLQGTNEDTVTDFEDGDERLDVSDFFDNAADAVAAARQDGADTVIDLDVGAGDSVRLTGINVNQIDETDFIV